MPFPTRSTKGWARSGPKPEAKVVRTSVPAWRLKARSRARRGATSAHSCETRPFPKPHVVQPTSLLRGILQTPLFCALRSQGACRPERSQKPTSYAIPRPQGDLLDCALPYKCRGELCLCEGRESTAENRHRTPSRHLNQGPADSEKRVGMQPVPGLSARKPATTSFATDVML